MPEPGVPPLRALYFYPTGDCNQRCRHCWVNATSVPASRGGTPLGADDLRRVVAAARPLGLQSVKVTGGEPFVRADTIDLIEALRAEEIEVDVETNATLVDDRLADRLARVAVHQVAVSLDGARPATHDALRRQPGAHARTLRAVERLVRREVSVQILFTLTRASEPEVGEVLALCADLGVDSFKLNFLAPMGRGRALHDDGLALPVDRLLAAARRVEPAADGLPFEATTALPLAFTPRARLSTDGGHRCPILGLLAVLDDGRLSICGVGYLAPELVLGDVRRDRLEDVWARSPLLLTLRDRPHARLGGVCGRCLLRAACLGACRANAFAATGDLWAPFWLCAAAEAAGLFPASRLG